MGRHGHAFTRTRVAMPDQANRGVGPRTRSTARPTSARYGARETGSSPGAPRRALAARGKSLQGCETNRFEQRQPEASRNQILQRRLPRPATQSSREEEAPDQTDGTAGRSSAGDRPWSPEEACNTSHPGPRRTRAESAGSGAHALEWCRPRALAMACAQPRISADAARVRGLEDQRPDRHLASTASARCPEADLLSRGRGTGASWPRRPGSDRGTRHHRRDRSGAQRTIEGRYLPSVLPRGAVAASPGIAADNSSGQHPVGGPSTRSGPSNRTR